MSGQTSPVHKTLQPSDKSAAGLYCKCSAKVNQKKVTPESDSLNAPYMKLTPILDIDPNTMDINEVNEVKPGKSKAADMCCIYCHNIGSYIWTCQVIKCGNPVCVSLSESNLGCLHVWPNPKTGAMSVTEDTFMCPQCHHDDGTPMTLSEHSLIAFIQYQIQGYSVRQDFLYHNYFPLLAVFLLWSGFGSPYAVNIIKMMLEEHYHHDKSRFSASQPVFSELEVKNLICGLIKDNLFIFGIINASRPFPYLKYINYIGND
ncbi:hypothetical protein EV702DRAFT_1046300 [Suillus placidus]|uniref:Uncharacterized protein n=1 Tax=Suillus placidus TaxID=48579 RepID=A0A9P7D2K4_9AGAM|nr:hypothetical protein EV702DRAFT_1046300 [Suillus placidus]